MRNSNRLLSSDTELEVALSSVANTNVIENFLWTIEAMAHKSIDLHKNLTFFSNIALINISTLQTLLAT